MKNNLNCNGCRYTVEKNRIACDCCIDRSNYSPRQRIRYGEDLDADIYTAIQKAMTNLSVTGTFMPAIENVMFKDPATIVFWADGTKTVVKALYEKFDRRKGLQWLLQRRPLVIEATTSTVSRYGRKGVRRIRISDASWLFSSMTISEKPWAA